jgi:hypothetical protein
MQRNYWVSIAARAAVVALTLGLGGCHQAIRDQAQVDPVVRSAKDNEYLGGMFSQPKPIIPNCSIARWIARASSATPETEKCAASVGKDEVELVGYDTKDPIVRRTQAQAELMTYADQVCDSHVAGIYASHSMLNFDLSFLSMLFSGGAAIATGRAATNLAAESALFSGARSLINSEVYYGYIGPAVMREIRALRGELRAQITEKRGCSVNDYPPQEAINDALIYHDACSFSTGLASLLSKAGSTRVGEDKLRVSQLRAMAARLVKMKEELAAAEAEFGALTPDAAKGPQGEMLKDRIAALRAEIGRVDGILAFAGVVDPAPTTDVPADPQQGVETAEAEVEAQQTAVDSGDATAQSKLDAANNRLNVARVRRDTLAQLDEEIATRELASATASKELRTLQVDAAALAAGSTARKAKEKEITKAKTELKETQTAVVKAKQERKSAEVPSTQQNGIEFGIQRCAPLTPPTVRQ